MEFFDCNASYGFNIKSQPMLPANTIEDLHAEMKRAGVKKAMVKRMEQFIGGTVSANQLLADDIKDQEDLYGIWALLPSHTNELADPEDMPALMRRNNIFGWTLIPGIGRYLLKTFVIRDWLELAIERNIPIFINTDHGVTLEALADILEEYPELTVILTYTNIWPSDRMYRPFVAEFPNFYIDLSYCITDGGIESFVKEYGSGRLLYGSGFPGSYFGANMLMIKHADISEDDKMAIANGNMNRIIRGVRL